MTPFAAWSRALALTESDNDPDVRLGDDGQAAGRWQQHPSFTQEWAGRITWGVEWTWDQVFEAALRAFYEKAVQSGVADAVAAVGFHLHGQPQASAADMASPGGSAYAARFEANLAAALEVIE